jgi:hypothetical protein
LGFCNKCNKYSIGSTCDKKYSSDFSGSPASAEQSVQAHYTIPIDYYAAGIEGVKFEGDNAKRLFKEILNPFEKK